jgi:uncharacterized protein (TIGR02391 family)
VEIKMATQIPSFDASTLNLLARALAEAMTHPELTALLKDCCIQQNGGNPKWERMDIAWSQQQARDGCANAVVKFIQLAMQPVRYVNRHDDFERIRDSVNRILAFAGLTIREDGMPAHAETVTTLSEVKRRFDSLHGKLEQRNIHPDVMRFCRTELLEANYFHAVLEAAKSVSEKLRQKSGLIGDGADLIDGSLGGQTPLLAINKLVNETEQSEQRGFVTLLKGIHGTFRNVTAHAPKVSWAINELDALDMLSILSYAHRRLDAAAKTRP